MTITINKDLGAPRSLLLVKPPGLMPEASTWTIVDHLLNPMDTVTYDLSLISLLLEPPGRQYGARHSKTRTFQRKVLPSEKLSCSSNLHKP